MKRYSKRASHAASNAIRCHRISAGFPSMVLPAILALTCLFPGKAQSSPDTPPPSAFVPAGYRLAWHDEFDGNSLDTKKWHYRTDKKMGSEQKEKNVSVSDGKLILHLTYDPASNNPKQPYSGGGVISKATFVYGYYEASFKIPKAQGWHTSFWLMGYDSAHTPVGGAAVRTSAQEIDICENESFNPRIYSTNLHKWTQPKKHFGPIAPPNRSMPDLSKDFHVWGCEVTPTAIRCFFNGKLVATYDPAAFEKLDPQNIWLTSICSLKVSRHGGMIPEEHPDTAEFDYVRFYENP